jgi:hypothetical protein
MDFEKGDLSYPFENRSRAIPRAAYPLEQFNDVQTRRHLGMDIKKLAFQHLKQAQKRLRKRGGIDCIATAYDASGARLFDTMIDCDDRDYKRIQQIEFQIILMRYDNAAAVVVSSEAWIAPDAVNLNCWPSESPNREEIIAVFASTPDDMFIIYQTFRRDEVKRKISFGPVQQGHGGYSAFTDLIWPLSAAEMPKEAEICSSYAGK